MKFEASEGGPSFFVRASAQRTILGGLTRGGCLVNEMILGNGPSKCQEEGNELIDCLFVNMKKICRKLNNLKKASPLKWSPALTGFGEFWSSSHMVYKDAIAQLSWIFFEGGVHLCEETQSPPPLSTPLFPLLSTPCATLFCLSLMDLLTSFLPIVGSGEEFTLLSSWPFCGICTAVWKTTQKRWFETKTVIYFAHSYGVCLSSARPSPLS